MTPEGEQKTPLEVVAKAVDERTIFEDEIDIARRVLNDLRAAGYVIARARVQWRH